MATAARDGALRAVTVNHVSLTLDQLTVPLDGKSNLLLRYRGRSAHFPMYLPSTSYAAARRSSHSKTRSYSLARPPLERAR